MVDSASSPRAAQCPFAALHAGKAQSAKLETNAQPSLTMQASKAQDVDAVSVAPPKLDRNNIPCPALAAGQAMGMLPTTADGTLDVKDLDKLLEHFGLTKSARKILVSGADATSGPKGELNLFKLNGSSLDHTGSTGIRQDGVHAERFEVLASFSRDGETLNRADFARAAERFADDSPGFKGTATQNIEFAALLRVFGREGKQGLHLTVADARSLFVEGQLPAGWQPKGKNSTGLGKLLWDVTAMATVRLFN